MDAERLKHIVEAALLAADDPLSIVQLASLFSEEDGISHKELADALSALEVDCAQRGIEVKQIASGYRLQVRESLQPWISRLWQERPPRYSRALLETLALIAYRQPITRGEIEQVRGVAVSTNIMRILLEREWIRVVGHRDVPGKPSLLATTKSFLDYFGLKSLDELPTLAEIRDIDAIAPELWSDQDPLADPAPTPGTESAEEDRAEEDRAEEDRAEEDRAEEDRAEEDRAEEDRAEEDRAEGTHAEEIQIDAPITAT